ncbi:MAG: hypothetical protein Q9180_001695 [Flavoplaca navasiana]
MDQEAKLTNPVKEHSDFNIPGWDNKPNLRADFTYIMGRHLENVKQAEKTDPNAGSTLGFVATYPYFDRAAVGSAIGKGKNGVSGTSRFNYFCYREMTEHDKPPQSDSNLINLPIRGIWTTANVDARGVPIDRGTIGKKEDRNYDWTESGKNTWFYSSFEGENPNKRERLTGAKITGYYAEDRTGFIVFSYCRSRAKSWCDTDVSFEPGLNTFTMKGVSGLHFWLQLHDWKGLKETDEMQLECKWSINFTMMAVKDGGLEIRVKADEPVLTEGSSNNFELADYQEGTLKPALDFAKRYFKESLQNLSSLEASLTKAFASQNKFFFPGSGSYFFKDPAFNHNGDMFCRISYNAAQQAVERSDIKVTKQVLPSKVPTAIKGSRFNDANAQKEAEEKAVEEKTAREKATNTAA